MFFVDAPFKGKTEKPEPKIDPNVDRTKEMWVPPEIVAEGRENRIPYFEAKEAMDLEMKELKEVRKQIGTELREHCRPEIDEYVDCMVGRIWTVLQCKPHAKEMRRCLKKLETPEYIEKRTKELLLERERNGTSILKSKARGNYNKLFYDERDPLNSMHNVEGHPGGR